MLSPDPISWLRVGLAIAVVFGLIALLGLVLKYVKMRGLTVPGMTVRSKRLEIIESFGIDVRRRLVIVRCDGNEHLLLLGVGQDLVIDKNLKGTP